MSFPRIRYRARPWAPWSDWQECYSMDEFDDVMMEEYKWGDDRCAEHEKTPSKAKTP